MGTRDSRGGLENFKVMVKEIEERARQRVLAAGFGEKATIKRNEEDGLYTVTNELETGICSGGQKCKFELIEVKWTRSLKRLPPFSFCVLMIETNGIEMTRGGGYETYLVPDMDTEVRDSNPEMESIRRNQANSDLAEKELFIGRFSKVDDLYTYRHEVEHTMTAEPEKITMCLEKLRSLYDLARKNLTIAKLLAPIRGKYKAAYEVVTNEEIRADMVLLRKVALEVSSDELGSVRKLLLLGLKTHLDVGLQLGLLDKEKVRGIISSMEENK